jgi:hypothetical protein
MFATEEISLDLNRGGGGSHISGLTLPTKKTIAFKEKQFSITASFDIPSHQLQNNGK